MSTIKNNKQLPYDPVQQVDLIRKQCNTLKPNIYKLYTAYFQHVRKILPAVVREAVIQIIMSTNNSHFNIASVELRKGLQQKIENNVYKYTPLLTVEQLLAFSKSLEKKEVTPLPLKMNQLNENSSTKEAVLFNKESKQHLDSVELSFSLPIETKINIDQWKEPDDLLFDIDIESKFNSHTDDIQNKEIISNNSAQESPYEISDSNHDNDHLQSNHLDVFNSIFRMARQAIKPKPYNVEKNTDNSELTNSLNLNESKESYGLMTSTPYELSHFVQSLEIALITRLRDLSNSINLDLLHSGVINTFVPLNLLDAILSGHITSSSSSSNIVKIQIPLNENLNDETVEIACILIQPNDLEFDNLILRKCRQQMTEQYNTLLKMVKQERYWQNRSLANEVRDQWLINPPQPQKKPNHPKD